jgi:hypothetical protein
MPSAMKCKFEKCTGNLKPDDNPKTPKGLFRCIKCKSLFRQMQSGHLALVINNFDVREHKVISLKELKAKKA